MESQCLSHKFPSLLYAVYRAPLCRYIWKANVYHISFPRCCTQYIAPRFTMRTSRIILWFFVLLCVACPQMVFCVICLYLPYITLHDLVDYHFPIMSLAFGGRGYIMGRRETDAGLGLEFDSTLGFPGEGPNTKRNRKRKLSFKRINLHAKAAVVMQQVKNVNRSHLLLGFIRIQ